MTDPALIGQAIELASYGEQLASDLQYPDRPPFEDLYPTHLLLFRATLGEEVDKAIEYFRTQAETVDIQQHGTSALETYLILLTRIGRQELALEEFARLVPADRPLSPHAPTLMQLAEACGKWDRYLEICRQRNDLVGFTTGHLQKLD